MKPSTGPWCGRPPRWRGRAFPKSNDTHLLDFLAEAYLREHRPGEAMDLIWSQFEASPWLDSYEKLKAFAEKAREKDHPEDALGIHERLAEVAACRKNNRSYGECKGHVLKVKSLMERLGRRKDFAPFLQGLMTRHKPKRNLMRLLADVWRDGG